MCYLDLCTQLFFPPKHKITFRKIKKKINIKNIKMKPPAALFKRESKKWCLLLKAKSQNFINSCTLFGLGERRKENL